MKDIFRKLVNFFKSNKYTVLFSTTMLLNFNLSAQTDLCSTDPSGEVLVAASCSLVTFNKSFNQNNGTAYWQNTDINNCGADNFIDTWGWFMAISSQTTIYYESIGSYDFVLHLFDHCSPTMNSIACSDNTQGAGIEQITYNTVAGQIYHFRLQMYNLDGSFNGRVCVYSNVPITPPIITGLSSSSGCPGSTLVINGTNLAGANLVKIGGTSASIVSKSDTSVMVTIGAGTTGYVEVFNIAGSDTSSTTYTVTSTVPTDPLGSRCNPFTSLSQVSTSIAEGQYYFDLGGDYFITKIKSGYVLIANDVGAPISQDLPETTILDTSIRGILPTTSLANLGEIELISIKSSNGYLDAESQDSTLLARVKQGITLHGGSSDNTINESWTGTSADYMKLDANCSTSQGTSLKGNIIHTCGAGSGMNWIPNLGYRRIVDASGQVPNNVSFGLWVKISSPTLPVSLVSFTGLCKSGVNELSWVTNSEHNNDYFTLQRSQDNTNFEKIGEVKGVGESSQTNAYTYNDYTKGLKGAQYYRLLQTDYDGRQSIGPTIVLNNMLENTTISYSLALHKLVLNIYSESNQEIKVELYTVEGRMMLSTAQNIKQGANQVFMTLPETVHGLYLLNVITKDQMIPIKVFIP